MRRILLVGSAYMAFIAELLKEEGHAAVSILPRRRTLFIRTIAGYDDVYSEYIMSGARISKVARLLGKRVLMHVVGDDAVRYSRERMSWRWISWLAGLSMANQILYAAPELRDLVGFPGIILPLPINTHIFSPQRTSTKTRDILYYCPRGDSTYRPDWIVSFARVNREKKITVLGDLGARTTPRNIMIVPRIPYEEMPRFYSKHRKLIRMTTHDGTPRMIYEAFSCGLDVEWNGKQVVSLPAEVTPEYFMDTFRKLI